MRLRGELQDRLGITPVIRPGWPTQFLVLADGEKVFARFLFGPLPEPGEIADRLQDGPLTG